MKLQVLLITILSAICIFSYSQNIVHLEQGNKFYVNPKGEISILQETDTISIETTPIFNENTFKWENLQKEITNKVDKEQTTDIKTIKQLTLGEYLEFFDNKRISIQNESTQIDFIKLNDLTFAYTTPESNDIPRTMCNVHHIEVDQRYITVLTDNGYNIMGYMYVTDKGLVTKIVPDNEIILPINLIQPLSTDEKEKIYSYFHDFFRHYKYFTVGDKYILCNRNNRPVKDKLFDKIIIGDTDILTQNGEIYTLYSKSLEPVDIGYIQVAHELTERKGTYIEAIVDNKHVWIKDGKILHENVSAFNWALHGRVEKPTNIKYSFEEYLDNDFKLVLHPQDRFSKTTYEDSIVLNAYKSLDEYQDVVFANHFPYIGQVYDDVHSAEGVFKATLMDDGFNDYKDYAKLKTENIFIQKNGKWGIDSLDMKVSKRLYELIELLPAEFDKLEELHYPMLDIVSRGRFDYLGWNRQPVIFYQGKQMGVYPMTKEAKYKKVDKNIIGRYFYRATLSNGKGAWLDVMTGKEYRDRE